jgi:pimeloyl-ACP methyl ester carboxylesterase
MLKLLAKVLLGLVVAIALALAAAAVYRARLQAEAAERLVISSPNGVDESLFVDAGGVEQWVTIRGQDRANPAILFVHGGPGSALSALPEAFLAYENDYTVVQWDQPGSAKSLGRAGGRIRGTLTLEGIASDGIAIAEFARARLGKDKLLLVGLSWGSVVGVEMARRRPDLFAAYVGTGLLVNRAEGLAVAHENTLARARAQGNAEAVAELVAIGPPPHDTPEKARTARRWSATLAGERSSGNAVIARLGALLASPRYTLADVRSYLEGYAVSDEQIDLGAIDLRKGGRTFELPFFVLQGADDYLTPPDLARTYVDLLTAPRKEFLLVPGGHTALTDRPEEFVAALNEHVRPVAFGAGAAR